MPDPDPGVEARDLAWKALPRSRPWYKKFAAQRLAEAEIRSPDGSLYGVRVLRDSPMSGLSQIASAPTDPLGAAANLVKDNLTRTSNEGWLIEVFKPATTWRSERVLYTQHVGAAAIVVDVTIAITDAITRGDKLWPDDEDY